jgi:hypothetical protein
LLPVIARSAKRVAAGHCEEREARCNRSLRGAQSALLPVIARSAKRVAAGHCEEREARCNRSLRGAQSALLPVIARSAKRDEAISTKHETPHRDCHAGRFLRAPSRKAKPSCIPPIGGRIPKTFPPKIPKTVFPQSSEKQTRKAVSTKFGKLF